MITSEQYILFLNNVVNELDGDWVVIGGSMLAFIDAESRVTADIDLCCISDLDNDKRISLMKLAELSGLNIEAINPAADYFLKKIPNWKNSLVLLKNGEKGNLFRPSLGLYLQLKLNRGTPTDIQDCISFINWHFKKSISFDLDKIKSVVLHFESSGKDLSPITDCLSQKPV